MPFYGAMLSWIFAPFYTHRLLLRCIEPEDAGVLASLMTEDVSRWLANWPFPLTQRHAAVRIAEARLGAETRDMMPFGVVAASTGDLIGWVGIARDQGRPRLGVLGYWLGTAYQGNGYMREAVAGALTAAFCWMDLDEIEAGAQLKNTASFTVMKACGMVIAEQRLVFAASRNLEELCRFYKITRRRLT